MALRLRRGTDAQRQLITPVQGELIYVTDTTELYVGDGTTLGGIRITGEVVNQLSALNDVDAALPQDGDVLVYDSGTADWISQELPIDDLSNVDTTGVLDGHVLVYNSVTSAWESAFVDGVGGVFQEGGDYRIDIIGGDSTTIIDSANGTLQGSVISPDGTTILSNGTDGTDALFIGSVTGDVAGDLTGNVKGNIIANDDTELLSFVDRTFKGDIISPNNVTVLNNGTNGDDATFKGSVTGNVVGNLTGDTAGNHTGNVLGGDSSVLINGENGLVYARVAATNNAVILDPGTDGTDAVVTATLVGDVQGNVTGEVTGTLIGNVAGELIGDVKSDDSTVLIDSTNRRLLGEVRSTLLSTFFDMDIEPTGGFDPIVKLKSGSNTGTFGNSILSVYNNHTGTYGQEITFNRSNGTFDTPTAATSGDFSGSVTVRAHDGSDYTTIGAMHVVADAVNGVDDIESSILFLTRNGSIASDYSTMLKLGKGAEVSGYVQFGSFTTTERDALTAANGMVIYNTTTNKFQGYENGAWANLI